MKPAYILLFVSATLGVSCAGPGARSITEELTPAELNRLLVKQPDYQTAVVAAGRFREQATEIERAEASGMTYDRLHDFLAVFRDEALRGRLAEEGEQEWREKYGAEYDRADSLVAFWQEFLDTHKPESYVRVELAAIDPAKSTYGTARVVLKVRPLKGAVDEAAGSFGIFPRGRSHGFGDFSSARRNRFGFGKGLTRPETVETWMNYSVWDIRDGDIPYNMFPENKGLPLAELLEKYDFDYTITRLVKDGRTIRYADIWDSVPASVREYWSDGRREERNEALCGRIVRELIDAEFPDREEYRSEYVKKYYYDLDPLAARLVYEVL